MKIYTKVLKNKIDDTNIDNVPEKEIETKQINEYDASRLIPLIYILKLGRQFITQHRVEIKDVIKDILSFV